MKVIGYTNVPMSTDWSNTTPIFRLATCEITWAPAYAATTTIAMRLIAVVWIWVVTSSRSGFGDAGGPTPR